MSSILTNTGAMVALQSLKSINSGLQKTQSEISTGKSISSAKDNSAIWAISKVMESDVRGFKGISDSLALGESTVAVARNASETVTDLLTQMKEKIVAAQEDNVDRVKIQADVEQLRGQIGSVVSAAQFNGLNLVNGTSGNVNILSSLDRDSNGGVTASQITVAQQDLSTGGYVAKAAFTGTPGVAADAASFGAPLNAGASVTLAIVDPTYAAGDKIGITIGDKAVSYTVTESDLAAGNLIEDIIATGLKSKIDSLDIAGLSTAFDGNNSGELVVTLAADDGGVPPVAYDDLSISGSFTNAGSGGLGALSTIDVSTDAGAAAALGAIETMIGTAIDASAAFGSVEGRIETQANFISKLTDSLKAGIGSLVDADMEEASAKLQALQVQQQLGVQALSIANQAPQSILSLFR